MPHSLSVSVLAIKEDKKKNHSYSTIFYSFKRLPFHSRVERLLFYLVLIATNCLRLFLWAEEKIVPSFRAKERASSKRGLKNARWERLGGKARKKRLCSTAGNGRPLIRAGAGTG